MSTAALTSQLTRSPEAERARQARRRPRITGATTERLPVRACSGDDLGPQPVAEQPALRLTRRGRTLVTAVSVLVFGSALAVLGLRVAGVLDGEPEFSGTVPVQVGAGQTLWSIAQEMSPTEDPRIVVERIADANGLRDGRDVAPGMILQIPVR
ncbi:MAG TPA: LysM domain-containing protein [Kribbella sp.]|nr:LysM domain-containing protein [Kribbella sp.]